MNLPNLSEKESKRLRELQIEYNMRRIKSNIQIDAWNSVPIDNLIEGTCETFIKKPIC